MLILISIYYKSFIWHGMVGSKMVQHIFDPSNYVATRQFVGMVGFISSIFELHEWYQMVIDVQYCLKKLCT